MGGRRKAKRDENEEKSGRVLRRKVQNPSAFGHDIFFCSVGRDLLHMFLEDGAGHPDRSFDLLLLFF